MPARLKISVHAQVRLLERGIDPANLKRVVLEPDFTESSYSGNIKSNKELEDGRVLEVIYRKEDFRKTNEYFIVTAYYI